MNILIVENRNDLADLWQRHLRRQGHDVVIARGQSEAIMTMQVTAPDMIILKLVLDQGSALAVSDFASYRVPNTRVIFVTDTTFFSDGSIFTHACNACAQIRAATPVDDLAAMVEYYAASA